MSCQNTLTTKDIGSQIYLLENPTIGKVIPQSGGVRKLRWSDRRRRKGKRGGLRLIYYYLLVDQEIWLISLYDKDEADDLTAAEKTACRILVREIKTAKSGE